MFACEDLCVVYETDKATESHLILFLEHFYTENLALVRENNSNLIRKCTASTRSEENITTNAGKTC